MKRLAFAIMVALLVVPATLHAQRGRGNDTARVAGNTARAGDDGPRVSGSVQLTFGSGHVAIIREHYAPRYRSLPPGLQKKYARTGQLPPGWQSKLEPFPVAIERQLPPLSGDYRRGVIDGHAVIVDGRTNVILDVAVLF
jgi:hypothetical protein